MSLFSSLDIYTVHLKPEESGTTDALRFIPEKFNWLAFAFTSLWALYHRLWWMLGIMVAANGALAVCTRYFETGTQALTVLQIGLHLWAGFQGNDFLRRRLKKDGFITAAIVSGESKSQAEQRFFDNHKDLIIA